MIVAAGLADGIFVSAISAWEIGLLSRPKGGRPVGLRLLPDPKTWFAAMMAYPGVKSAPFTSDIAIDASYLPGELHGDPGDRLLIATARHLGAPMVTRDKRIIAYGAGGHVNVVRC